MAGPAAIHIAPSEDAVLHRALVEAVDCATEAGAPLVAADSPASFGISFTREPFVTESGSPEVARILPRYDASVLMAAEAIISYTSAREVAMLGSWGGNAPSPERRVATMAVLRLLGMAGDTDVIDVEVGERGIDAVRALVAIHHDPRLAPGMSRASALPVVRLIAREIVDSGSVRAWRSRAAGGVISGP